MLFQCEPDFRPVMDDTSTDDDLDNLQKLHSGLLAYQNRFFVVIENKLSKIKLC